MHPGVKQEYPILWPNAKNNFHTVCKSGSKQLTGYSVSSFPTSDKGLSELEHWEII